MSKYSISETKKLIYARMHELKVKKAKEDFHQFENVDIRAQKLGIRTGALIEFAIRNKVLLTEDKKTGVIRIDRTQLDEVLKSPLKPSHLHLLGRSYADEVSIELLKKELLYR